MNDLNKAFTIGATTVIVGAVVGVTAALLTDPGGEGCTQTDIAHWRIMRAEIAEVERTIQRIEARIGKAKEKD